VGSAAFTQRWWRRWCSSSWSRRQQQPAPCQGTNVCSCCCWWWWSCFYGGCRTAAAGGGGQHAVPGAGGHLDHLGLRAQQAQQVLAAIAAIVEGHTPTPLHALTVAAFEEDIRAAEAAAGGGRKRPREEADAGAPTGAASPSKAAAGGATPAAAAAVHARDATHPGLVSSQAGGEAAQREGCWPAAAGGRQRLVFHTTPPASRHPEVPRALNGCLVDPTAAAAAGVGEGLQLQQQFGAVGSRACCLDVQQKVLLLADAPADTGTRIRRVSCCVFCWSPGVGLSL
jgi:hypothetical protein